MKPSALHVLLGVAALLSACATGLPVDTRYVSRNQDSRVLFIVVHYTVGDFDNALRTLTEDGTGVSSHYLVDDEPPTVYRLVDESRRAWHAGSSCWKDHCGLNASSVGIEIVNPGWRDGAWTPFAPAQIDAVVALIRDVAMRHGVRAERILGHNEIQPEGKEDPGPLFPWLRLHESGLIAWPTAEEIALGRAVVAARPPMWHGSRPGWPSTAFTCRRPASSTRPPGACCGRSRCATGPTTSVANPTPRRPPCWWP